MDYLDPRKRRRHRHQLAVGYALMAVAIFLGVYLLVKSAGGYGFDTKTGSVIVNGLLFLDSKPGGADIYLNGQNHGSTTAARLILPAGNYTIDLKKSGYRDWHRAFTLTEHQISRFVYPFLFPVKPVQQSLKSYVSLPVIMTESPDRHWLLVQDPSVAGGITFDEYDTSNLKLAPKQIAIPDNLLATAGGQLKVVEWSTDNKNLLLQDTAAGASEFIIFNRETPTDSFNINKTFNVNPTQVALRNKKIDQLYFYDQPSGLLQVGNTGTNQITDLLTKVLAFKPSGSDLILYITDQEAPAGQVVSRIWNNGKTYPLYSFDKGNNYLIDMAQFQGNWYYAAGSDAAGRVNIYKNPLDGLTNTAIGKALPMISLHDPGANKLSFSANTRFVETEAGQSFAVYDFETDTSYHYSLAKSLSDNLHWMDGHRLIGASGGTVFVTDYDSTNQQLLVPTASADAIFFDTDYNHLFSLASVPDGSAVLYNSDMRAGVDLPKNP